MAVRALDRPLPSDAGTRLFITGATCRRHLDGQGFDADTPQAGLIRFRLGRRGPDYVYRYVTDEGRRGLVSNQDDPEILVNVALERLGFSEDY